MIQVYGVVPSPYVRKVLMTLGLKGINHEIIPVFPGKTDESYAAIHPMRKVPALRDGDFTLPDSSAIMTYLDGIQPKPPIFPKDPRQRAFAVWLEEFADTRLSEKVNGGIYAPKVLGPVFFGKEPDEAAVARTVAEELPPLWDYMERRLPAPEGSGPAVGDRVSVADLAMATIFVSMRHGGQRVSGAAYPRTAAYAEYLLGLPYVIRQIEADEAVFAAARAPA